MAAEGACKEKMPKKRKLTSKKGAKKPGGAATSGSRLPADSSADKRRVLLEISSTIREHGLVVFAGAGVSKDPPSEVPDWFGLNGMILDALKRRVTSYLGRNPIWLDKVIQGLVARRDAAAFPPEYQAQIMEEECGRTYFGALTAVDLVQYNRAHRSMSALAIFGVLRAVVTTNFDRLTERAFEADGIQFTPFIDEEAFQHLKDSKNKAVRQGGIPILKIHGSADSPASMIDTLQQRMRGRKDLLEAVITHLLGPHVVLYVGFSAADLNHNPDYLGLVKSAQTSQGALFVQFPGSRLEPGAQMLLDAYGIKPLELTLDELFSGLFDALQLDYPGPVSTVDPDPPGTVANRLKDWADSLQPYEAINTLAALLDAGGEEHAAFTVLHKTWKNQLPSDSKGEHYERYQYNYARHCVESGEMKYEETPQNFIRSRGVVPQSSAGFALWNLYRARVSEFWPYLMDAKVRAFDNPDPRLEGDMMLTFARAAVIYRWVASLNDVIEAGNRQYDVGDVPRAVRLLTTAARLAAISDDPGSAFALFDHCEPWVKYLGDDTCRAELYLAQGMANFELGSMYSTGRNYMLALPIFRRYQRWPSLIEALIAGVRYYVAEGRIEDCRLLVREAAERIAKGYEIYYPHLGIAVAEYHLGVEQWERAKRELVKSRPFAEQSNNEWALSKIDTSLNLISEATGEDKS